MNSISFCKWVTEKFYVGRVLHLWFSLHVGHSLDWNVEVSNRVVWGQASKLKANCHCIATCDVVSARASCNSLAGGQVSYAFLKGWHSSAQHSFGRWVSVMIAFHRSCDCRTFKAGAMLWTYFMKLNIVDIKAVLVKVFQKVTGFDFLTHSVVTV